MMDKPNFIAAMVLVFIIAVIGGFYLGKAVDKEEVIINNDNNLTIDLAERKQMLIKDDFVMSMPTNWVEEVKTDEGIVAMIVNNKEEATNQWVKELDFKTYSAVSFEALAGRTPDKFIEDYKSALSKVHPGIIYSNEKTEVINGYDAYLMEARFYQDKVYFKVLISLIKGRGEEIWAVTFNTLSSNWDSYRDLFYQTLGSFQVR